MEAIQRCLNDSAITESLAAQCLPNRWVETLEETAAGGLQDIIDGGGGSTVIVLLVMCGEGELLSGCLHLGQFHDIGRNAVNLAAGVASNVSAAIV